MDPMITPPVDRKPLRPLRLVLLLGMTALLFLMILDRNSQVAGTVVN